MTHLARSVESGGFSRALPSPLVCFGNVKKDPGPFSSTQSVSKSDSISESNFSGVDHVTTPQYLAWRRESTERFTTFWQDKNFRTSQSQYSKFNSAKRVFFQCWCCVASDHVLFSLDRGLDHVRISSGPSGFQSSLSPSGPLVVTV